MWPASTKKKTSKKSPAREALDQSIQRQKEAAEKLKAVMDRIGPFDELSKVLSAAPVKRS